MNLKEFLRIASPSTVASLITDIDENGKAEHDSDWDHTRDRLYVALVHSVGEYAADAMLRTRKTRR